LKRNKEKMSGKRNFTQICLACGSENDAQAVVCEKCRQPLSTPQLSRKRNILEIVAVFAFLIVIIFVVTLVYRLVFF